MNKCPEITPVVIDTVCVINDNGVLNTATFQWYEQGLKKPDLISPIWEKIKNSSSSLIFNQ